MLNMAVVRPQVNLLKLSLNVSDFYPKAVENISSLAKDPKYQWHCDHLTTASFVFRHQSGYIYQLFKKGHINLTNVRRFEDVHRAISIIFEIIDIPKIFASNYNIDNIQASGIINLRSANYSLKRVCDGLSQLKDECRVIKRLSFECQRFPGAFIKFQDGDCKGTILLFNSRKFVLVGLRRFEDINKIHDWLESSIWRAMQEK